jgi:8-oxo-dGTP pyrophosphatase MutT (NUDIX family)
LTTPPIRDAATVILLRDPADNPKVLMGQRGAGAAFMPNKFVFPGGAVDAGDSDISLDQPIGQPCAARLEQSAGDLAPGLVTAAIRELWEEAGLVLGTPGNWGQDIPADWQGYAATGHVPSGEGLHFVFRAITPPNRARRFDARFFLADAAELRGDADDFSAAADELSHLQWVRLDAARDFDLPFITEVVLAEIAAALPRIGAPASVPFFNNTDEQSLFERLAGRSPLAGVI